MYIIYLELLDLLSDMTDFVTQDSNIIDVQINDYRDKFHHNKPEYYLSDNLDTSEELDNIFNMYEFDFCNDHSKK